MASYLDWTVKTADITERGFKDRLDASAAQRKELAAALEVPACESLVAEIEIRPLGVQRFRIDGTVRSKLERSCVVSLEPVEEKIAERFEVECRPEGEALITSEGEQDILGSQDIQPIRNGMIDLGQLVFEIVAGALDPYPRKEGATFDWRDPTTGADQSRHGPFAALAKLKPQ